MSFTYKVPTHADPAPYGRATREPKFDEIDPSEGRGIRLRKAPHTRLYLDPVRGWIAAGTTGRW